MIRDTKGSENRVTMLPDRVMEPLQSHLTNNQGADSSDNTLSCGVAYLQWPGHKGDRAFIRSLKTIIDPKFVRRL